MTKVAHVDQTQIFDDHGISPLPGSFPIEFVVPVKTIVSKAKLQSENSETPSKQALMELECHHFQALWELDKNNLENYNALLKSYDNLIQSIDSQQLAIYFGTKHSESKESENFTKLKDSLVYALSKKIQVLTFLPSEQKNSLINSTFIELSKWLDESKLDEVLPQYLLENNLDENLGSRLQLLLKKSTQNKIMSKPYYLELQRIFNSLGWTYLEEYVKNWNLIKFPQNFEPF